MYSSNANSSALSGYNDLPNEVRGMIAQQTEYSTLPSLARVDHTNRTLAADHILHRHVLLVSSRCTIPNHVGCSAKIRKLLEVLLATPARLQQIRSIELIIDNSKPDSTIHSVALPIPAGHHLDTLNLAILTTLVNTLPTINAGPWLHRLRQHDLVTFEASLLILASQVRHISIRVPNQNHTVGAIIMALREVMLNQFLGAHIPAGVVAPFQALKSLEIGYSSTGRQLLSHNEININIQHLPSSLSKLTIASGTLPNGTGGFINLLKALRLDYWGCRLAPPSAGHLPTCHFGLNHQDHHTSHSRLTKLIEKCHNLEELELLNCRVCDDMLQGLIYMPQQPAPSLPILVESLPAVMGRTLSTTLRKFAMTTKLRTPTFQDAEWVFLNFKHHMGSWDAYNKLQTLSIDSWFLFPRDDNELGVEIVNSQMPTTIETIGVWNVVLGYREKFWDWLELVESERAARGLQKLRLIEWSLMEPGDVIPPPSCVTTRTLPEMISALAALGIELVQR